MAFERISVETPLKKSAVLEEKLEGFVNFWHARIPANYLECLSYLLKSQVWYACVMWETCISLALSLWIWKWLSSTETVWTLFPLRFGNFTHALQWWEDFWIWPSHASHKAVWHINKTLALRQPTFFSKEELILLFVWFMQIREWYTYYMFLQCCFFSAVISVLYNLLYLCWT